VVRSGTVAPGMYELDINARHRLAVSGIKMGDRRAGTAVWTHPHTSLTIGVILAQDIADAYYDRRTYTTAVTGHEMLVRAPSVRVPHPPRRIYSRIPGIGGWYLRSGTSCGLSSNDRRP